MKKAELKKYERFRLYLCEKYDRKCYTNGCPLARQYCYIYLSFTDMYHSTVNGRAKLMKAVREAVESENYNLTDWE